jgi:hypothetical protein
MAVKYWKGGNAGVEASWTEGLTSKTLTASAAVDNGDGTVRIPCSHASDFVENDYVVIAGTDNYDGNHRIVNVDSASSFDIIATYVAETFSATDTAKSSNWQDEFGVPAAVPAAADTVIFNELAGIAREGVIGHAEGNHWNCFDNVTISDTGGLDLAGLIIDVGFTGKIGIDESNNVTALHMSIADGGEIRYEGTKPAYIECSGATAVEDKNIPTLVYNSGGGFLEISSDVNDGSWTSSWDNIVCIGQSSGILSIANNTNVEAIHMYDSRVSIYAGTGVVDVKASNDPVDLFIHDEGYAPESAVETVVATEAALNFGTTAWEIRRLG